MARDKAFYHQQQLSKSISFLQNVEVLQYILQHSESLKVRERTSIQQSLLPHGSTYAVKYCSKPSSCYEHENRAREWELMMAALSLDTKSASCFKSQGTWVNYQGVFLRSELLTPLDTSRFSQVPVKRLLSIDTWIKVKMQPLHLGAFENLFHNLFSVANTMRTFPLQLWG